MIFFPSRFFQRWPMSSYFGHEFALPPQICGSFLFWMTFPVVFRFLYLPRGRRDQLRKHLKHPTGPDLTWPDLNWHDQTLSDDFTLYFNTNSKGAASRLLPQSTLSHLVGISILDGFQFSLYFTNSRDIVYMILVTILLTTSTV